MTQGQTVISTIPYDSWALFYALGGIVLTLKLAVRVALANEKHTTLEVAALRTNA